MRKIEPSQEFRNRSGHAGQSEMLPLHRMRNVGGTNVNADGYDDDKYHKSHVGGVRSRFSARIPSLRVLLIFGIVVVVFIYMSGESPKENPTAASPISHSTLAKDAHILKLPDDNASIRMASDDNSESDPDAQRRKNMSKMKDQEIIEGGKLAGEIDGKESKIGNARAKLKEKEGIHYKPINRPAPKPKIDSASSQQNPIPTEQFLFHQIPPPKTLKTSEQPWAERQQSVVEAFKHAWGGYVRDAWGMDEYQPLSKSGSNWNTQGSGLGLTIVDALDTMLLMNLTDEYEQAKDWVENVLDFEQGAQVNIFETTIRILGGLLSAYHLSGNEPVYLKKATDLAERLLPAFNTNSGIPLPDINLSSESARSGPWNMWGSQASTAEVTTLQLEFKYLAHLTGRREFWDAVENIMIRMRELEIAGETFDGLVPIYMSIQTGSFSTHEIRLGSRGDSYYEYLLKQYLQTSNQEPYYLRMYNRAVDGIKNHLVAYSYPSKLLYIGELLDYKYGNGIIHNKMDHLVCFMGGNLALGATGGLQLKDVPNWNVHELDSLKLGKELTQTCWETYRRTGTGLAPEIVYFETLDNVDRFLELQVWDSSKKEKYRNESTDIIIKHNDAHCLLRPETVESLFIMWRITGEVKYRKWGWSIFKSFEEHTKVESGGYTSLEDVRSVPAPRRDKMETFFLAETLKYLYLLFSPDDVIPLDKYVFNTEAHPLPKFVPKWKPTAFWDEDEGRKNVPSNDNENDLSEKANGSDVEPGAEVVNEGEDEDGDEEGEYEEQIDGVVAE